MKNVQKINNKIGEIFSTHITKCFTFSYYEELLEKRKLHEKNWRIQMDKCYALWKNKYNKRNTMTLKHEKGVQYNSYKKM